MNGGLFRREFLSRSMSLTALSALPVSLRRVYASTAVKRRSGVNIKIGLNAYSFNRPLTAGKMTLNDVVEFCAIHNVGGLDATGYYFPGYPDVPSDECKRLVNRFRRRNPSTLT
jgi:hypothetical protein